MQNIDLYLLIVSVATFLSIVGVVFYLERHGRMSLELFRKQLAESERLHEALTSIRSSIETLDKNVSARSEEALRSQATSSSDLKNSQKEQFVEIRSSLNSLNTTIKDSADVICKMQQQTSQSSQKGLEKAASQIEDSLQNSTKEAAKQIKEKLQEVAQTIEELRASLEDSIKF